MSKPYTVLRVNSKVWGTEEVFADQPAYCGKIMHLNQGFQCSIHRHLVKDETFHVLSGKMTVEIFTDGVQSCVLTAGQSMRIAPGTWHRFRGDDSDCTFVEASTHDSPEDNERRTQSGKI